MQKKTLFTFDTPFKNQIELTVWTACVIFALKAKEKYRGVFEIQKSGDKTSSGEIGLDIRTHASPKVGQDQVSGGVSVLFHMVDFHRLALRIQKETSTKMYTPF